MAANLGEDVCRGGHIGSSLVSVDVRVLAGGRDLKKFIDLPFRLHANQPLWVPPLKIERRLFLNRKMNAFFSHGTAEYFLALRDGRVVGRVSAHVNDAFNEHQQKNWGWFGFLEFEDDQEVLDALLDAAASWLKSRGNERMVGPASFTMNDDSGGLVEGYELKPMIAQPWNPPYYRERIEQGGLTKAIDLLMWRRER